jgi:folate-binding protein YgfZ
VRTAKLEQYGLLLAAGDDARAFLHAQLTNDIENLPPGRACHAGWCTAKGRLLATFLVVPFSGGFLLQLARDLAPAVAKRLAMFILRSKVKLSDVTGQWQQYGVWHAGGPSGELAAVEEPGKVAVRIDADRVLVLSNAPMPADASADDWTLAEVRAGRVLITQATQDQFVPQMVNLELSGGVDFQKGCYPGQEIVARAQYRGEVKRRLYRLRGAVLEAGQDLYTDESREQATGKVVNAAGEESLAVLPVAIAEAKAPVRAQPQASALEILSLPYSR